jgi:hypothetical protein
MRTKSKKTGRSTLPEELRKVQRTITLSPEADAKVGMAVAEKGSPYYNNRSKYIESVVMASQ